MKTASLASPVSDPGTAPLPADHEFAFYNQYGWCLNAFPTLAEVVGHLREEINKLDQLDDTWRRTEVMVNIFLLSCAISDAADDYLLGRRYDFLRAARVFRPARLIAAPMRAAAALGSAARAKMLSRLMRWRDGWETAVGRLMVALASNRYNRDQWAAELLSVLDQRVPAALLSSRPRIPAAFRSQDLTHFDAYKLGTKFIQVCPDRDRPVLVVGLRTAGSYFAPLLRGYLEAAGYRHVDSVTLRPKQGIGTRERAHMERAAAGGARAAIIDEPVFSAGTVAKGLHALRHAGFQPADIVALFPVHPNRRDWNSGPGALSLSTVTVLRLEPEEWHKQSLLEPDAVSARLSGYFGGRAAELSVTRADRLTAELIANGEPGFHSRLKCAYEVESQGLPNKRVVVAKSVGWGWLGYHAFLAGTRLSGLVPKVLGLRDGLLFTEWRPPAVCNGDGSRERALAATAAYLGARVRELALEDDPAPGLMRAGRHRGAEEMAAVLSGAYGSKIAAALKRPRIQHRLLSLPRGVPVLIDGKMRPAEWVDGDGAALKTDFEHHGMGKHQLNISDPAYDVADAILQWNLSEDEERKFIEAYAALSGDRDIAQRLFLYKLLAGSWAMARAAEHLANPALRARHEQFNARYLEALRFLTVQTMRFSAMLCRRPDPPRWSSPLVVLDIDGVLDKQIFGFPSTTAAGIRALWTLASHGIDVALNTAKSVYELKEYAKAYGFVGGVAEYGSFVWDAVSGRERVLVGPESLAQMERLKARLRAIPGVFLNDAYRYSIRCFAHTRGVTVPVPEMLVRNLIANLGLDRLRLHQTYTDSTVTAVEADKGSGLRSLLSLAGHPELETFAVGDSEPDLPMFAAASRCFAPGQIACVEPARLLGCRIALRPEQRGLLEIARHIVHPHGGGCRRCVPPRMQLGPADKLFYELLRTADRSPVGLLARCLLDPMALRAFEL
jgi:hydroxymethylpyrimidine pyrophosphatase-like HAD family hydrolase